MMQTFSVRAGFTLKAHVASVWVKRGSEWLLSLHTATSIPFAVIEQGKVRLLYPDSDEQAIRADDESDDAVMKEIVANEQKIFDILKRNDLAAFRNMLPDDLIDVEDDGIHTKSEWLKEFEEQKKTGLLFTDFKMEDLRLVRYSPNAATLVFKETVGGTQNGKRFESHINSSSGCVRRDGKWVPVLYQDMTAK